MNSYKYKLHQLIFCLTIAFGNFTNAETIYSISNIDNGKVAYEEFCAECHSISLRGTAHGNELVGKNFLNKWNNKFNELFININQTMPPGNNNKVDHYKNNKNNCSNNKVAANHKVTKRFNDFPCSTGTLISIQ